MPPATELSSRRWACGRTNEKRLLFSNYSPRKGPPSSPLSSRPERTRISYFAALARTTGAVSLKGNRMKSINAKALDRKSGGAQWRDLCVDALSWKYFLPAERTGTYGSRSLILQLGITRNQAGLSNQRCRPAQSHYLVQDAARQLMLGHLGQFYRSPRGQKSRCVAIRIKAQSRL